MEEEFLTRLINADDDFEDDNWGDDKAVDGDEAAETDDDIEEEAE